VHVDTSVAEQQPEHSRARIAELEAQLVTAHQTIARLRERYMHALEKLALAERRIVAGKAERRLDTNADQLAFEGAFAELKAIEKELAGATSGGVVDGAVTPPPPPASTEAQARTKKPDGRSKPSSTPTGRRDLSKSALPEVEFEILDPEREGKCQRIGFEDMYRLGLRRGGKVRVHLRLAVYKEIVEGSRVTPLGVSVAASVACVFGATPRCAHERDLTPDLTPSACDTGGVVDVAGRCVPEVPAWAKSGQTAFRIVTTERPRELLKRGLLAPSMIAHLLVQKYVMGVPFHRLEQKLSFEEFPLDRSTMCRYAEHIGATLGAIVEAARAHFIATAFCLSTDATGASIQPEPLADGSHQPCRKGHFFVTLADRDHVFFDYQPKHNSLAVWTMFKGYSGYIQADAHVIYDALFRGTPPEGAEETDDEAHMRGPPPKECACYSHARRKYWEAAVCRHPVGLEGLKRINAIFAADAKLADLAPAQRKVRRDAEVRPLVDDFFAWAKLEKTKLTGRGLVATAIGYVLNHEQAFHRFLEDGRLKLDNNRAENALRSIATARKAWLFFGSDDHASAAANLFSLVASCKLHHLDPEAYLADVIRVMPYWPTDRYVELAPKYWTSTRAALDPEEMKLPLGRVTVPPPLTAVKQASTS